MSLVRLLSHIATQPLAMHPTVVSQMRYVLARRMEEGKLSAEDVQAAVGSPEKREVSSSNGVMMLPVHGVIGHRAHLVQQMSSGVGTSTEILASQIRQARQDSDIGTLVLDIESPGGGVFGLTEVAEELRAAREEMRVIAHANSYAASAAYWIAAQAGELWVDPDGEVGSIGVWTMHQDVSARLAEAGIDVTLISAGEYKVEGNPFEPLGDEAKAELQRKVDEAYDRFVNAVADGRGVSSSRVKSDFGKGRMVFDREAVSAGMADQIGTMSQLLSTLGVGGSGDSGNSRRSRNRARLALAERR